MTKMPTYIYVYVSDRLKEKPEFMSGEAQQMQMLQYRCAAWFNKAINMHKNTV